MDERTKVIDEIKLSMVNHLDSNQIAMLDGILLQVLDNYDVSNRETRLVTYDNSNYKALEYYVGLMKMEGKSENTIKQYAFVTKKCLDTIGKQYMDINDFDMKKYFANLSQHVSSTTYNNYLRYINQFFKWLQEDDHITTNPLRKIKSVTEVQSVKKPFTNAERDCLKDNAKTLRDKALITFLYSTGCRISEALRLNIADVIDKEQIVVYGKGKKERIVSINDVASYYLNLYLDSRTDNQEALFVSNKNAKGKDYPDRLTKFGAEAMLRKLGKECGIEDVHPHRFRRTLCCSLLEKGMPIQEVQVVLGHSNISTTTIYNYVNPTVLQNKLHVYS